jgi:hypothetical protein
MLVYTNPKTTSYLTISRRNSHWQGRTAVIVRGNKESKRKTQSQRKSTEGVCKLRFYYIVRLYCKTNVFFCFFIWIFQILYILLYIHWLNRNIPPRLHPMPDSSFIYLHVLPDKFLIATLHLPYYSQPRWIFLMYYFYLILFVLVSICVQRILFLILHN